MKNGRPDVHPWRTHLSHWSRARSISHAVPSTFRWAAVVLLGLLTSSPARGQIASPGTPAPRPLNPVLSGTGGSCGTQFAPCPAISRLGLFIWFSGQYLGTGLGGNPHASTLGGSVDIAMEVANRVAVSANIPGALNRIHGQTSEEIWGIGGPLEVRARARLGPASSGFYTVQARPLWSSVIEVRTQFLIPGLDGDSKYVGRVQRGSVQPAVYGAGELNVWRFQLAPGVGILVGDRQAHADLSLRVSVQLLDRLYGDVEVLRRQALGVPAEPGRCRSAWMGAAGARWQFRRGVFMNARYVGGQGDCVPESSVQLNLGLAFGEGLMRIPTPEEVGFIKTWHALLRGMIDPVLDCQGIMRADDGTPMFRFGYPEAHDPNLIRRNNVEYHVGEHFWEKDGNLYRDTDLTHPVLDVHGESPLTFAERAAMHDCPTLPGLGSPCQVALNLPMLRHNVEHSDSPMQLVVNEDAQILACLSHLSPLKAAAMFRAIQAALGPLIAKLPQLSRWQNPTAPTAFQPDAPVAPPAAVAATPSHSSSSQPGRQPQRAESLYLGDHRGPGKRPPHKLGVHKKPAESDELSIESPHSPSLPSWSVGESSGATVNDTSPTLPSKPDNKPHPPTAPPTRPTPSLRTAPPYSKVAQNELQPNSAAKTPPTKSRPEKPTPDIRSAPEPVAAAPIAVAQTEPGEHGSQEQAPAAPICGTHCKLIMGGVAAGVVAVGGEVTKDVIVVGVAAGGGSLAMSVAGVTGGAVAGKIVVDGTADHITRPSAPADPPSPASAEKSAPPSTSEPSTSFELDKQHDHVRSQTKGTAAEPRADTAKATAKGEETEETSKVSKSVEREVKEAEHALKKNQDFRRWFHREYKADQVAPKGSRTNPDLTHEQVREAYQEWTQSGMPKVK